MKQIIAIIQPHRLDAVEHALQSLSHLPGFTLFQVRGHARGRGVGHLFAADEWNPDMHCLLYTSPSPRDKRQSRMPSSA